VKDSNETIFYINNSHPGPADNFCLKMTIHSYPFSFKLKALPTVLFAYLCFKYLKMPDKLFIGPGFLCCTSGDIFLDFSRESYFIHALISFLSGHIFYTLGFLQQVHFTKERLPFAIIAFVYTSIITIILLPRLGNFLIPVVVYIMVITIMGISAAFISGNSLGIFIGAMIFIVSDSLIAINKFLGSFNYSTPIIISLYFIAQYTIGTGVLHLDNFRKA